MPTMMHIPIHCMQCGTYIRSVWMGDARSPDDAALLHRSLCKTCKRKQRKPWWKKLSQNR